MMKSQGGIIATMSICLLIQCSLLCSEIYAGDEGGYNVSNIPGGLRKDAEAVVRKKILRFEVKSASRAVEHFLGAVTIFSKEKESLGDIRLGYSKFTDIESLEGRIYDAGGKKIRELGSGEIEDKSAIRGYTLFNEEREKSFQLYHNQYPYTIEYEYEITYHGFLNWPAWYSRSSFDPVELSRFEVIVPADENLRYHCKGDSVLPVISTEGNTKRYVWQATNLPGLSEDEYGNDVEDAATVVRTAPLTFELDGYEGSMKSWKDFGHWYLSLTEGRNNLPDNALQDIRSLATRDESNPELAAKIYRYMQSRTRYVSVQLGIGGWQPFDAQYVHEHGYGDCKALSNYTVSLLGAAGITAYPVLIKAGSDPDSLLPDFPCNQFNHAIACVPGAHDSLWLECTSQLNRAGHLGSFTENRQALMITPQGGFVVRTPKSSSKDNEQLRHGTVFLEPGGDARASITTQWTGDKNDDIRGRLEEASPKDREEWIENRLGLPNASLSGFTFSGFGSHGDSILLSIQLALPRFASVSGERIFFQPSLLERSVAIPPAIAHRVSPVRFEFPYHNEDSVLYTLPSGYAVETLPGEERISSSFGEFFSKCTLRGDSVLVFTRSLAIRDYEILPERYAEYRKFFASVVKSDRGQVVLVSKNRRQ